MAVLANAAALLLTLGGTSARERAGQQHAVSLDEFQAYESLKDPGLTAVSVVAILDSLMSDRIGPFHLVDSCKRICTLLHLELVTRRRNRT
jgi:hypothetical protein